MTERATDNEPFRVLHVTECFNGGVQTAIRNIAESTLDIEHHLFYSGFETVHQTQPFATVTELPRGMLRRIRSVRRAVKELEPDLVHAHSSWAGVYARATPLGVPVVYQPHCYAFENPIFRGWARRAYHLTERMLVRRTVAVIAVSAREETLARSLGKMVKVWFVPNYSQITIASLAQDIEVPSNSSSSIKCRIAMAGRICSQKDPGFFIELVRSLERGAGDFEFVWIGDGDPKWRRELEQKGVRVTGWLSPSNVALELDSTSFYAHTARYEGFPLSILDAAARGVGVIARDISAFDGEGLATASTPGEMAALIERARGLVDENLAIKRRTAQLDSRMTQAAAEAALREAYGYAVRMGRGSTAAGSLRRRRRAQHSISKRVRASQ